MRQDWSWNRLVVWEFTAPVQHPQTVLSTFFCNYKNITASTAARSTIPRVILLLLTLVIFLTLSSLFGHITPF